MSDEHITDERAAFEAWTQTQPHGWYPLKRDQEGKYWADGTDMAWDAWQARAAPRPAAQPVGEHAATVAEVHMSRYTLEWNGKPYPEGTKLYTTPQPVAVPDRVPMTDEAKLQWEFIRDRLSTISMYQDSIGKFVEWFEAHHGITTPKADK